MSSKDEWMTIRLSAKDKAELERLAELEERTLSGMVRLAIRELLNSRREAAA